MMRGLCGDVIGWQLPVSKALYYIDKYYPGGQEVQSVVCGPTQVRHPVLQVRHD